MATTALYRKSSFEVVKISLKGQEFSGADPTYWGVLTDPSLPDGSDVRPIVDDWLGPLRVLGYSKYAVVGTNTVRNATQEEIDTFEPAQLADEDLMDAEAAKQLFQTHPRFRKMMIAFSDIIKDEINILREWTRDLKTATDNATSLATFKSNVATLPDLSDRDLNQLKTAILNRISEDD